MKAIQRQFKQLFIIVCLVVYAQLAYAQTRYTPVNKQVKDFTRIAAEANVIFTLPEGFKEVLPINNEELTYDYGITLPGHEVEIWFSIKSYKYTAKYFPNPDSAYINLGKTQVSAFSADNAYFVRNLNERILSQYNADEGKSYLLNLNDSPATKHYKYALILTMQKDHTGTIMAVCLTNDKGPEFFKSIDKARNCLKFKQ